MSRRKARQHLAEFHGATDIVTERCVEEVVAVMRLAGYVGADVGARPCGHQ
ncbi:MAG TPA: hypothetical protein PLI43_00590 [Albidovulum sp.]|uniref:hypothetical protein n=1 Tax=Albidovulum sp. TaxID=1872424 RepID=UPI002CAEB563|nr:hypothetical protein [Albidovulum sp.]